MSHKSLHDKKDAAPAVAGTGRSAQDGKLRDGKLHKETLQVTKEIVVKFIEMQRVSPANFAEVFPAVYSVVCRAVADSAADSSADFSSSDAIASDSTAQDARRRD